MRKLVHSYNMLKINITETIAEIKFQEWEITLSNYLIFS